MKSFLILLSHKQIGSLSDELLNSHIGYLKQLYSRGHLVVCGPCTDNEGAVLVIRADSLEQAESLVKEDPFVREKYYQKFIIKEFMEANDANDWLATSD